MNFGYDKLQTKNSSCVMMIEKPGLFPEKSW
jgi:hypothetical protein